MKEARYKMSHISWFHFCDMSGTDKSIESICRLWELGLEGIGTNWEGLMLKLNLQYFGHLMWRTDSLERPWCWERLKAGGEGDITDLMDMNLSKPQEFLMDREARLRQSMNCNESDTTEQLNRTDGNSSINQWEVKLLCFSSFKDGKLETAEGRRVSSVTET